MNLELIPVIIDTDMDTPPATDPIEAEPADAKLDASESPRPDGQAAARVCTLPNVLTLSRFFLAAAFLAVFQATGQSGASSTGLWICFAIVVLAETTDLLDGLLARQSKQVSDFGKLMDPYADSVYRLTCFFCFASDAQNGPWIPIWMVLVLFYRDIVSSMTRVFALRQGMVVAARGSGKVKAWTQAAVMMALILLATLRGATGSGLDKLLRYGLIFMWIAVVVAVWSGIDYIWANRKVFRV